MLLEEAGITTNNNMVPFDKKSPLVTSGIRIGTPALTTRGMGNAEMIFIAELIDRVINDFDNEDIIKNVRQDVYDLCKNHPIYKD